MKIKKGDTIIVKSINDGTVILETKALTDSYMYMEVEVVKVHGFAAPVNVNRVEKK